jgi:hypothetical protein
MVKYIVSRTLDAILPQESRHDYKFSAILGDLQHKLDVYFICGDFGRIPEQFFSNEHQADYLRTHRPDLVPPSVVPDQPPSVHTLGTVFEFHYYSDLRFRFDYKQFILRLLSLIS